jgi:transcriptional regulator with XRE-family HTH domain
MTKLPIRQGKSTGVSRKRPSRSREVWSKADGLSFKKIRKHSLNWSQKRFADELGVDQSLISAWEVGSRRPSSVLLLEVAAFPTLDHDERLWLIGKAGMDPETIEFSAAGFLRQASEPSEPGETVSIKPMRKIEGKGTDLRFPKRAVPNWVTTKYVTVRDNFMQPMHKIGDILLVDESQRDPWKLEEGTCVAVYRSPEHAAQQHWSDHQKRIEETHPREEVEERKRRMSFPYAHIGLFVGWLHGQIEADADGKLGFFFLEAPWVREMLSARQSHFPPGAEVIDASSLTILGRVIAWIASPESAKQDRKK